MHNVTFVESSVAHVSRPNSAVTATLWRTEKSNCMIMSTISIVC